MKEGSALATRAGAIFAILFACSTGIDPACAVTAPDHAHVSAADASTRAEIRQLEWDSLLPDAERANFRLESPRPMHNYLGESAPAAHQIGSLQVNKALNGQTLKVPGFIVPLNMSGIGEFSEFFLVPYVGACIHVPPPPPNQIVYVKLKEAQSIEDMWVPYWVTGKMTTEAKDSKLGLAAYSMVAQSVELFR